MMVGDEWVYIAPPKTGTRSMYAWLAEHYGGKRVHPSEDHQRVIPDEHRDKFVFTTVRNPYARFVSIYWSMYPPRAWSRQAKLRQQVGGARMSDLLTLLTTRGDELGVGGMPIHTFLDDVKPDMLLRIEHINEDREMLPFQWSGRAPDPVTRENRIAGSSPKVRDVLHPDLRKQIQTWAGSDFELGGYER